MSEIDVFGKLSRIFETHGFTGSNGGDEEDLQYILEDFDGNYQGERALSPSYYQSQSPSPYGHHQNPISPSTLMRTNKPTPYEVWNEKYQKKIEITKQLKPTPKLNGEQWDRLVDKMHQSNRVKQSAMIKEQNEGLAMELGGYLFKPRINKTSLDLSSTMKSLQTRLPEMITEREKELEQKRKESEAQEMLLCTFAPQRKGVKVSENYLKRMGRNKKVSADDLIQYEQDRKKRIDVRKQILSEIEGKELTFKPQLSKKTQILQEKLLLKGSLNIDPITRTAITSPDTRASHKPAANKLGAIYNNTAAILQQNGDTNNNAMYEEGPMLVIESDHPYHHNTNEYTTVQIPGAISYTITFHPDTRTEPVYDFIKFFDDETHTDFFGANKYSGGYNNTPGNWPGVNNKPPLIIPSKKFIIHFKTNGSANDWGFRMHIVPMLLVGGRGNPNDLNIDSRGMVRGLDALSLSTPCIPNISDAGKSIRNKEIVFDRLFKRALDKQAIEHNNMVELMQSKLNIPLKPWEQPRAVNGGGVHISTLSSNLPPEGSAAHSLINKYNKTHMPKAQLADYIEDLVLSEEVLDNPQLIRRPEIPGPPIIAVKAPLVSMVEYDDSLANLWKHLRYT